MGTGPFWCTIPNLAPESEPYSEGRAIAWIRSVLYRGRGSHRRPGPACAARDASGQGLAEYALILALIAIVAIIALIFLGTQVSGILSTVGASV